MNDFNYWTEAKLFFTGKTKSLFYPRDRFHSLSYSYFRLKGALLSKKYYETGESSVEGLSVVFPGWQKIKAAVGVIKENKLNNLDFSLIENGVILSDKGKPYAKVFAFPLNYWAFYISHCNNWLSPPRWMSGFPLLVVVHDSKCVEKPCPQCEFFENHVIQQRCNFATFACRKMYEMFGHVTDKPNFRKFYGPNKKPLKDCIPFKNGTYKLNNIHRDPMTVEYIAAENRQHFKPIVERRNKTLELKKNFCSKCLVNNPNSCSLLITKSCPGPIILDENNRMPRWAKRVLLMSGEVLRWIRDPEDIWSSRGSTIDPNSIKKYITDVEEYLKKKCLGFTHSKYLQTVKIFSPYIKKDEPTVIIRPNGGPLTSIPYSLLEDFFKSIGSDQKVDQCISQYYSTGLEVFLTKLYSNEAIAKKLQILPSTFVYYEGIPGTKSEHGYLSLSNLYATLHPYQAFRDAMGNT